MLRAFLLTSFLLLQVLSISSSLPVQLRSDCGYIGITEDQCSSKGCDWLPSEDAKIPWCFRPMPQCNKGYTVANESDTKTWKTLSATTATIPLSIASTCSGWSTDITNLFVSVTLGSTTARVQIIDSKEERYNLAKRLLPMASESPNVETPFRFEYQMNPFRFKITRKSDKYTLFETTAENPLIFQNQYMEMSTILPVNANIYGLGEYVGKLRRDPNITRQTLWNRDTPTPVEQNVYGAHPFFMAIDKGNAYGAYLHTANGADIVLLPGSLTYKLLGGIIDLTVLLGPTPLDVITQYQALVGKPAQMPYWALGHQHCRYGFKNIQEVEASYKGYLDNKIPLDTMWIDIDYMDRFRDFTWDPVNFPIAKVQAFREDLKSKGGNLVLIIDPAIPVAADYEPYVRGLEQDVYLKHKEGDLFKGKVWPGETVFPDFMHPNASSYWIDEIKRWYNETVPVDGLWIDMNEVANFCHGDCRDAARRESTAFIGSVEQTQLTFSDSSVVADITEETLNSPGYKINNGGKELALYYGGLDPEIEHYGKVTEYDVHNIYGILEAKPTREALIELAPEKRPFVLSRSTFPGIGSLAGHWTGDNWSNWEHLAYSIPGILNFQMFGVPYTGADICGFIGNTWDELCTRWMELGAFYPFSRNHNGLGYADQEPYRFEHALSASVKALNVRYSILPYYYTQMEAAHKYGLPVWRALFWDPEWKQLEELYDIDHEFMIGEALLFSPVVTANTFKVMGTFPPGVWYDWYTMAIRTSTTKTQKIGLEAPLDHINIHVRGGHIVTCQYPALTTEVARENNYYLVVPLDTTGNAHGSVYLDDGISLNTKLSLDVNFKVANRTLSATSTGEWRHGGSAVIDKISILGVKDIASVEYHNAQGQWKVANATLTITGLAIRMGEVFSISW